MERIVLVPEFPGKDFRIDAGPWVSTNIAAIWVKKNFGTILASLR